MSAEFSDYLVFADESGDHDLDNIDAGYQVFVLAFCVIRKSDYVDKVVPAIQRFKLSHFGHEKQVRTRPPEIHRHFFGYQRVIAPGIVDLRFSSAAEGR